ncbi:hypothetical protein SDC9_100358 [bioreactor metagenome]|uniref:Uncharacterized protein n=1 Tax=bioreactor metagenome TaxID=1076179 RepID=A0A645AKE3_9ZZZZ
MKWDWGAKGVNIRTESQLEKHNYTKKTESIQYALISEMRENGVYSIVFDDDGPGEIADVIGIREQERTVRIDLFHCKFSSEDTPGARLLDLYEVCGQAEKSVKWRGKAVEMIGRMENRERKRLKESKPSRFEVGDISKLHKIKNKLFIQETEMFITIVQPGVDSSLLTSEMHSLLVASQAFCMDTYSVPLRLICS